MTADAFEVAALVAAGCAACGCRRVRVRAMAPAVCRTLDGEPVSAAAWEGPAEATAARAFVVECVDCGRELGRRAECPRCGARDGARRALEGHNGIVPPTACPRCEHGELKLHVDLAARVEYLHGALARRVADAELGEPGFQVRQIDCAGCGATVAELTARCPTCGRSSLLKKVR